MSECIKQIVYKKEALEITDEVIYIVKEQCFDHPIFKFLMIDYDYPEVALYSPTEYILIDGVPYAKGDWIIYDYAKKKFKRLSKSQFNEQCSII